MNNGLPIPPLPKWIEINDRRYYLVIFRIHSKYEEGDPEDCTLLLNDTPVELSADQSKNLFMTAYVPAHMVPTQRKSNDDG